MPKCMHEKIGASNIDIEKYESLAPVFFCTASRNMYKETRSFQARCDESRVMLSRYSDRVPVIIEPRNSRAPPIDKRKYMAPRDITLAQLMFVVRKRLSMRSEQALFFLLDNNCMAPANSTVGTVYDKNKNDDDFLYIGYALENTFG